MSDRRRSRSRSLERTKKPRRSRSRSKDGRSGGDASGGDLDRWEMGAKEDDRGDRRKERSRSPPARDDRRRDDRDRSDRSGRSDRDRSDRDRSDRDARDRNDGRDRNDRSDRDRSDRGDSRRGDERGGGGAGFGNLLQSYRDKAPGEKERERLDKDGEAGSGREATPSSASSAAPAAALASAAAGGNGVGRRDNRPAWMVKRDQDTAAAAAAAGGGGGGAAAGGAEEENGLVEGGDGGGGEAAAAAAAVAAEKDRPSAVVVVDEFDDSLDDRINQKPESSKVLLQRAIDATNLPWWERAADGNTETAKELFHKSTRKELLQVNWRNPDNHERSAVQACAFRGQRHALVWLVTEMGAKVNGTDSFGCTALNLAARGGYPKIVRFLLENRAKTETEDRNGWTAAVWALAMGHIDVLQVMADMGVPLADLGRAAPFDSAHMSPTTLLPLPCVRYKADQAAARLKSHKQELALRARAHSERQESLRQAKEEEMMGMQEKLKQVKIEQYKHRYMRDARENWSKRPLDKQKPPKNKDKDNGGSLS